MNRTVLPWIAAGIGLVLALVLFQGGAAQPGGGGLPLLTALLVAEFGFFVSAGGCYLAYRQWAAHQGGNLAIAASGLACTALGVGFLVTGLSIWNSRIAG